MVGASVLEGNFLIILTAFSFIYNLSDLAKGDAWETACNATCMGHACQLYHENVNISKFAHRARERKRALTCTFVPCTPKKALGPFGLKRNTKKFH
jgi:geranylgeranyl pyrophosphate synthase